MGLQRIDGRLVVEAGLVRLVEADGAALRFHDVVTVTRSILGPLPVRVAVNLGTPDGGVEDVVVRLGGRAARRLLNVLRDGGVAVTERRSFW